MPHVTPQLIRDSRAAGRRGLVESSRIRRPRFVRPDSKTHPPPAVFPQRNRRRVVTQSVLFVWQISPVHSRNSTSRSLHSECTSAQMIFPGHPTFRLNLLSAADAAMSVHVSMSNGTPSGHSIVTVDSTLNVIEPTFRRSSPTCIRIGRALPPLRATHASANECGSNANWQRRVVRGRVDWFTGLSTRGREVAR